MGVSRIREYLAYLSLFATFMLTIEGIWILYTTRERKFVKNILSTHKKICVLFPSYKDVVHLDEWLDWSKGTDTKYIIVEDAGNINGIHDKDALILKRDNRNGFKAGALNYALDYMVQNNMEFDYVLIFDADHTPYNESIKDLCSYLNEDVIQFFWYDGLPKKTILNWLTFSSRYYSNWNLYNRNFSNLTGTSIAIKYNTIKRGLRVPESITEDYALTLNLLNQKNTKIKIIPFVVSIGNSPKNFKAFLKQQIRWAEGTIRDSKNSFKHIMKNHTISFHDKFDFLLHVNMYTQGFWMILTLIFLYLGVKLSYIMIPLLIFQLICYMKTLAKAPKKYWVIYIGFNYFMAVIQLYAMLRGVFIKQGIFYKTDK